MKVMRLLKSNKKRLTEGESRKAVPPLGLRDAAKQQKTNYFNQYKHLL